MTFGKFAEKTLNIRILLANMDVNFIPKVRTKEEKVVWGHSFVAKTENTENRAFELPRKYANKLFSNREWPKIQKKMTALKVNNRFSSYKPMKS